ncbi:MAG TPA: DUF4454 domain-containing protein [Candidatus Eisenbergiella intestinigallinarum]|uniref:DUF4454 domain-containing protein n=1 Tax=Candidatus Eisenbergiella intestinigallinarum TaxID=2838549 RepID=A0A9D2QKA3_9FIRM|nr:DUF4454 domain-containing protein [Candidatus Eisenbergiella intestinigallinarum]
MKHFIFVRCFLIFPVRSGCTGNYPVFDSRGYLKALYYAGD